MVAESNLPMTSSDLPCVLAPTITVLPQDPSGQVLLTGSHGGTYTGRLAAGMGLRGVIFHDAGRGLADAGVAGLAVLGDIGVPAVALDHRTCRVGDPYDMAARGRVSVVNVAAAALGAVEGMPSADVVGVLAAGDVRDPVQLRGTESRTELYAGAQSDRGRIVLVDSAAAVKPGVDDGTVIVTGSHGGLIDGDPTRALKAEAFAAVFNDAGVGIDEAGIGRLAALEERGIAAFTVAADTARIGEAFSTLAGTISHVNALAARYGAVVGDPASHHVLAFARLA